MKTIRIGFPAPINHGLGANHSFERKIRCHCGWVDKTFQENAKILANQHNEIAHKGNYTIKEDK